MIDVFNRLNITKQQLENFCQHHHIVRLSFFGSVLRDDFRPDSDVDVLVRFSDDLPENFSAIDLVHIRDELVELFGRDVDFIEEGAIQNPFRLKNIMGSRKVLYEAA